MTRYPERSPLTGVAAVIACAVLAGLLASLWLWAGRVTAEHTPVPRPRPALVKAA